MSLKLQKNNTNLLEVTGDIGGKYKYKMSQQERTLYWEIIILKLNIESYINIIPQLFRFHLSVFFMIFK